MENGTGYRAWKQTHASISNWCFTKVSNSTFEKVQSLQQTVPEIVDVLKWMIETWLWTFSHTKINSKWSKAFNVSFEILRLLQENVWAHFKILSQAMIFPNGTKLHPPQKKRIMVFDKWDSIKLNSFYKTNETISRIKKQPI